MQWALLFHRFFMFVMFARKRMKPQGMSPGSVAIAQPTGWMTIVDNHSLHIFLAAVWFCRSHHIVLLGLRPHTTPWLQLLDVALFDPF